MYFLWQSAQGIMYTPASDFTCCREFLLSMLCIVLDARLTVFMPRLLRFLLMLLLVWLLGRIMYLCGELDWVGFWTWFLVWILRALALACCIKDVGYWRFRKVFIMCVNSSSKCLGVQMRRARR